jgi:hypothetical protein
MNWSRIASVDTWKALVWETYWKIAPQPGSMNLSPTWPLDPRELERICIIWPSQYEWNPSRKWVEPLLHGFRKYVRIESTRLAQDFKGIVLIQIFIGGRRHDVAIDYSDLADIDEVCARRCAVYFKMQFSRDGYSSSHILPGGFVPNSDAIYEYLPHVRSLADRKLSCYDVYGRFGLEFADQIRRKACSLLATQNHFRWEGSLRIRKYSLALREIARSKICIDLPGKGDFCFRLVDYLAVGACVIAPRHHTVLHIPLVDREHIVYAKEDLSDLIDLCNLYLEKYDAREALRQNSRSFFERYLHRDQLAAYYLRSCLDRLT